MWLNWRRYSGFLCLALTACAGPPAMTPSPDPKQQVHAAEDAFARSMAQRDLTAFAEFVDDEAVFFSGPAPLRGKAQVLAFWARYFDGPQAPFSWAPDEVEILDSGSLALSSGPVRDAKGQLVARFTSIWRRNQAGVWRVVFDKGSEVCACTKAGAR